MGSMASSLVSSHLLLAFLLLFLNLGSPLAGGIRGFMHTTMHVFAVLFRRLRAFLRMKSYEAPASQGPLLSATGGADGLDGKQLYDMMVNTAVAEDEGSEVRNVSTFQTAQPKHDLLHHCIVSGLKQPSWPCRPASCIFPGLTS